MPSYQSAFKMSIRSVMLLSLSIPIAAIRIHSSKDESIYTVKALSPHLGAFVEGYDLGAVHYTDTLVKQLKKDVAKYGVLLFKKTSMTPTQQWELSNELGTTKLRLSQSLPTNPVPEVMRFSNNASIGFRENAKAWHTHGTWSNETHRYLLFRSVNSVPGGATSFINMKDLFRAQPAETQQRWRELYFIEKTGMAQPFIQKHPQTGDEYMSFHISESPGKGFVRHMGLPNEQLLPFQQTREEINAAIENSKLAYDLEWEDGDVALVDNRVVAHKGYDSESVSNLGLRVLDVTNIRANKGEEDKAAQNQSRPVPFHLMSKILKKSDTQLSALRRTHLEGDCILYDVNTHGGNYYCVDVRNDSVCITYDPTVPDAEDSLDWCQSSLEKVKLNAAKLSKKYSLNVTDLQAGRLHSPGTAFPIIVKLTWCDYLPEEIDTIEEMPGLDGSYGTMGDTYEPWDIHTHSWDMPSPMWTDGMMGEMTDSFICPVYPYPKTMGDYMDPVPCPDALPNDD